MRKQKLNLTLDMMAERFQRDPTPANANRYREVALDYWEDEMIGDESLLAVLHAIRNTP